MGQETRYEVSDHGRLRSLTSGRVLRGSLDQKGYRYHDLSQDPRDQRDIHVMVLESFVGPRPPGKQGRHLDDDQDNNYLTNLRWGTSSENCADRVRNGHDVNSNKQRCLRQHLLVEPNLVPSALRHGRRSCLSCQRAQSINSTRKRRHLEPIDVPARAQLIYEEMQLEPTLVAVS